MINRKKTVMVKFVGSVSVLLWQANALKQQTVPVVEGSLFFVFVLFCRVTLKIGHIPVFSFSVIHCLLLPHKRLAKMCRPQTACDMSHLINTDV